MSWRQIPLTPARLAAHRRHALMFTGSPRAAAGWTSGQSSGGAPLSMEGGYPTVEAKRSFRINNSLQKAAGDPVNLLIGKLLMRGIPSTY